MNARYALGQNSNFGLKIDFRETCEFVHLLESPKVVKNDLKVVRKWSQKDSTMVQK